MTRSEIMSRVRSTGSRPEMAVRRTVHAMGYRYRLHDRSLPGKPDLVFGPRRKVIFVHGCFWHGHACKLGDRRPKTRTDFWNAKIERNMERDSESILALSRSGWSVQVLWECELRDAALKERIKVFLGEPGSRGLAATAARESSGNELS